MSKLEKDFSLKEGEKISVSIKGLPSTKKTPAATGGGLKKLAPPKGLRKLAPPGGAKKEEEKQDDDLLSLDKKDEDGLEGLF